MPSEALDPGRGDDKPLLTQVNACSCVVSYGATVQLMFPEGTGPPVVGGLKLHDAVSTTVPGGCWTVTVALTKARSVMVSVQLEFGHSGAPGIGLVGGEVVTPNATFPFLTSWAGMPTLPDTVTRAGFCPGAWVSFVP